MKNKIAFVVLSCDNYSDLWNIFIKQFEVNWSNCELDKYFVTNFESINSKTFKEIKIGSDLSWSDNLIKVLQILKTDYEFVLITLEDLPIMNMVDNDKFNEILDEFIAVKGNYLKFIRKPKHTKKTNKYFGEIESGSLYRPTCVYALWRIEVLSKLLVKNENAWEFEKFGSIRSDIFQNFFVVYVDFFKVINTIVKRKWVPKELKKIIKLNYMYDKRRPKLNFLEVIRLEINTFKFNVLTQLIPWKFRRNIVLKLKGTKA